MLPIPETYALGSTTMLVALGTVALACRMSVPEWWYTAVSAATLSTTITNWQAGLFATLAGLRWRRAVQVSFNALGVVVLLWAVQSYAFPDSDFFLTSILKETTAGERPRTGGPLRVLSALVLHSVAMPRIQEVPLDRPYMGDTTVALSVQSSPPGSGGVLSIAAVVVWAALLGLGAMAALHDRTSWRFHVVLGALIVGQLVLHVLYGGESFTYVVNVLPPLIVLASRTFVTRGWVVARPLAALLVVLAAVNNLQHWRLALTALSSIP
jgi:hypothetical protein